jgi:hypothetical protein
MEQLPYIDEHIQVVDAPADVVWAALTARPLLTILALAVLATAGANAGAPPVDYVQIKGHRMAIRRDEPPEASFSDAGFGAWGPARCKDFREHRHGRLPPHDALVDLLARELAGDAGIDCGSHFVVPFFKPQYKGDSTAAEQIVGIGCALNAQDAGVPFRVRLQTPCLDCTFYDAYVRTPSGASYRLKWYEGYGYGMDLSTCAFFAPSAQGFADWDGGPADLACQSPGPTIHVCGPVSVQR